MRLKNKAISCVSDPTGTGNDRLLDRSSHMQPSQLVKKRDKELSQDRQMANHALLQKVESLNLIEYTEATIESGYGKNRSAGFVFVSEDNAFSC